MSRHKKASRGNGSSVGYICLPVGFCVVFFGVSIRVYCDLANVVFIHQRLLYLSG